MRFTNKLLFVIAFFLLTVPLFARTYSTTFSATENPVCEGSPCSWTVPGSAASQWGNVQTNGTTAFGVSLPTSYGDPTAILAGTWGPDQTVQAKIVVNKVPAQGEVELRLRMTISSNNIKGYEVLCPTQSNPGYGVQVVRWNGLNGKYAYLTMTGNTGAHQCVNGDVLKATITGTNPVTIKVYLNGAATPFVTGVDHGTESNPGGAAGPWTSGNPGIGFYDNQDNNWNYFGLTSFMATDGSVAPPTGLSAVVQ
jgi:hypothetical protein